MNGLKKIQYNCKKATFLIEKQQTGRITLREQLELKIHLSGCSVCKTFRRQSIIINQMVRNLFDNANEKVLTLNEQFKQQLQEQIEDHLDKI